MPAKKSASKKSSKKKPIYQRILLKISGESLQGPQGFGIHGETIQAIARELKIPIRFVGVGEKMDDLIEFSPDDFVESLFAQ